MRSTRLLLLAGFCVFALAAAPGIAPADAADKNSRCTGQSYPVNPWCPGEKTAAPGPGNSGGGAEPSGGGDDDDDDDDDTGGDDDDDDDDDTGGGDDDDSGGGDDDDAT